MALNPPPPPPPRKKKRSYHKEYTCEKRKLAITYYSKVMTNVKAFSKQTGRQTDRQTDCVKTICPQSIDVGHKIWYRIHYL